MNPKGPTTGLDLFAALLRLEQVVLAAESLAETRFIITNETRSLAPFVQAVLFSGKSDESLRVDALSNLSEVDRTTPFVAWAERLAQHLSSTLPGREVTALGSEHLSTALRREWPDFALPHLLWIPLHARENHRQGALLLSRDLAWTAQEQALFTHLACIYAFALQRFNVRKRWHSQQARTRKIALWTSLLLLYRVRTLISPSGKTRNQRRPQARPMKMLQLTFS